MPYFEAFEYGAWITFSLDSEILYLPIPKIKKNDNNQCHADGEPALVLPDEKWYFLNGVNVPEYLAMTPESKLDIEFFKKEENVEVRAQFVRKFGIERMKSFGKVVSKQEDYELIDMSSIFETIGYAPYLKMLNPSTGTIHMEGVHPDCKTVEDAINFRNGTKEKPLRLT